MNKFIVANWKMNPTNAAEAKRLLVAIKKGARKIKRVEIIVCPPFVYLPLVARLSSVAFGVGGQDVFWEEKGAYTGEVSAKMLKDFGCKYVIVGHSERRRYFKETDETISKKLKAAVRAGLKIILCVGETLKDKKNGQTTNVLKKQLQGALRGVSKKEIKNVLIAYEPVWAIGTGKACGLEEAISASIYIKKTISSKFGRKAANLPVLYGGSVNSQNAAIYLKENFLQGLLVGGASLDAREFTKIIKNVSLEH